MSRKGYPRIGLPLLIVLASLCLPWIGAFPAQAQTPPPERDESCMSCHENLYLLYDTGKYICMCGIRARCTHCHAGVVDTLDKEAAHEGLIASPVRDNVQACQSCHPQDYEDRVDQFIALGGIRPTPVALTTYGHPVTSTNASKLAAILEPEPLPTWKLAGFGLVALGFVGAVIFGIRCCRADRRKE